MSNRKTDPRIKVERAKKQIGDLNGTIDMLIATSAYDIVHEVDGQTVEGVVRFRFKPALDRLISCGLGDALHNLWAALDHLIYWIMPPAPVGRWTRRHGFPVARNATQFERSRNIKTRGLPDDVVRRIDSLEPYRGGSGNGIWQLHELNRIDQHRLLMTQVVSVDASVDFPLPWMPQSLPYMGRPRRSPDTFADQKATALMPSRPPSGEVDLQNAMPIVAFDEPTIIQRQPVIPALHDFTEVVDGVISRFDDVLW